MEQELPKLKNDHPLRQNCLKMVISIVKDIQLGVIIEKSIYNSIINYVKDTGIIRRSWDNPVFRDMYINKCREILINLDESSHVNNNELLKSIKNGSINPKDIGNLTINELFPSHWEHILKEKERKEKVIEKSRNNINTGGFKCKKCKSTDLLFNTVQLRSADEGMDTLVTCNSCGNKFKA